MELRRISLAAAIVAETTVFAAPRLDVLCPSWQPAEQVGTLDAGSVGEASGIAVSREFPGRLYHINDSGDGPYFYTSASDGSRIRRIEIAGFEPRDVEDLALGPCPRTGTCLFVGDIGDNGERRQQISVVMVAETAAIPAQVAPLGTIALKYPDGPHNAEGLAVHPNGDLYILTKEMHQLRKRALPAQLFRLPRSELQVASSAPKVLEKVAEIDLPLLLSDQGPWGQIVTSFDIAPDGKRILILTYTEIIEVALDVAAGIKPASEWVLGQTYRRIQTPELGQQEAVSFGLTDREVYFDTEFVEDKAKGKNSIPLYRQACSGGPSAANRKVL